jgi:hypothetical protein
MSITKFMVTIGPIHEKDLSDVCKQLDSYPDIRVSTYASHKPKRVVRSTGIKRMTITDGMHNSMVEMRREGMSVDSIVQKMGCSRITVERHTLNAIPKQKEIKV